MDLNDLGFREYINSATIGDESTSGGAVLSHGGAEAKYGENTDDHANAAGIGASGWGSWTGIAWVGSPIHVVGNNGKFVDVTYAVHLKGITTAGGNSTGESKIDFIVRNDTTGEIQTFNVYSVKKNRIGAEGITEWRDDENSVYLRPGENYTFMFKTETSISVHGVGEASARFGPQVPDTWDPQVDPYRIYISE